MRRDDPRRSRTYYATLVLASLGCWFCGTALAQKTGAVSEQIIADVAEPTGPGDIKVEGVGLVIGLQGTGSDPGPSWARDKLVGELRRNPDIKAETFLASKNNSLVLVKGVIPVGVSTEDRWNVEVELPPDSETTSLAGGFLMMTELREIRIAGGGPKEGRTLASAYGPILTGDAEDPENLKVGRVLSGAWSRKELPYILLVKEKHQSARTAKMLEDIINYRFFQRERGFQAKMAEAKQPSYLELRVPRLYHQNQIRYFQLIKQLPMVDNPSLREQRLEKWGKELLDPETAGISAIRLEGVGSAAAETLRNGLESPHAQVRFFAAEALAYLDDESCVNVLAEAIVQRPEFRAFALAALSAMEQPAATMKLRALMDEPDIEVRYGAFNALRTIDPTDSFLGRVRVYKQPERDPEEARDALAMRVPTFSSSRDKGPEDPFELYIVDSDGPPMVHVSRNRRREIVLFGSQQELVPPIVLGGTGPILLNASKFDESIQISRIEAGPYGLIDQTLTCSPDLLNVVRTICRLGGNYPQVIEILQAAHSQRNLAGAFIVDAAPRENSGYDDAQIGGVDVIKDNQVQQAGFEGESGDADSASEEGKKGGRGFGLLNRLRERTRRR